MDFLSIFKIFLDLLMLFVLGFSFGTEKLTFKKYCYNIVGSISIVFTVLSMIEHQSIMTLVYGLMSAYWFILSICL